MEYKLSWYFEKTKTEPVNIQEDSDNFDKRESC